jgi:zinc transporter 1/2/3
LIAIAILEIGILLHSVFIGLTLSVNEQFTTLFIVIIFHRKFG